MALYYWIIGDCSAPGNGTNISVPLLSSQLLGRGQELRACQSVLPLKGRPNLLDLALKSPADAPHGLRFLLKPDTIDSCLKQSFIPNHDLDCL